jgi:hypothetical protein
MSKARDLAVIEALTDLDGITDGTTGQVLTTDGSGTFTFSDSPSGDLVDDTTPQLGGDLDLNSSNITGTGNIDITGQVTLGGSSPEIKFNNSTDGGIEIAMRLNTSEGLEFYEPEDSDKVQFTIKDDSGVDATYGYAVNGTSVIDSGKNIQNIGNITLTGTVDGRDVATDGTKLDNVASNATANPNALDNLSEDTTPQLGGDLETNSNDIKFADNDKAIFGASSDLQIYHDGSHSYIHDVGAGDLRLKVNDLTVQSTLGTYMMRAVSSGPVSLYYSNFPKLDTTSTGINVTGNIALSGTVDGRDVATDGTKLDGIAVNATNVSALTDLSISDGTNGQVLTTDGSGTFTFEDGGTNTTLTTYNFTATSNQTTFSGTDSNGNTLGYATGNLIVSVNGVVHRNGVEYTATNGTSVVFSSGLETSDEVSIVTFSVIDLTNIDYSNVNNTPSLATVATSGSYSDLSGTPSLATVATSGSYSDLSGTPTIPTNNNQLTNGAGYLTKIADSNGSTSGYIKLSNGLIIQWGRVTSTGTPSARSFPTTFPSNCTSVVATSRSIYYDVVVTSFNTSSFTPTVRYTTGGGNAARDLFYIATGY